MLVDFSYLYFVDLFPGFLIIALGLYALIKNPTEPLNRILFIFSLPIFFRGVVEPVFRTAPNLVEAEAWNYFRAPTLFLMMPLLLHFCIVFYERHSLKNPWLYPLIYGPAIAQSLVSNYTKLIDGSYHRSFYGSYTAPGAWYTYSYLLIMLYMLLSIVFASLAYRRANNPFVKKQATLIILGTISPALVGTITDEILPLLGYYWTGMITFSSLFITIFFFIAITRFRLAQISPDMAISAISYSIPDALITTRASGEIDYCNQLSTQLFLDPLVNKNIMDFSAKGEVAEKLHNFLNREMDSQRFETEMRRSSGESFIAAVSCSLIRNENGRIIGILWDIRDLSSEYNTKNALQKKESELEEKIGELERMNEIMRGRDEKLVELRRIRDAKAGQNG